MSSVPSQPPCAEHVQCIERAAKPPPIAAWPDNAAEHARRSTAGSSSAQPARRAAIGTSRPAVASSSDAACNIHPSPQAVSCSIALVDTRSAILSEGICIATYCACSRTTASTTSSTTAASPIIRARCAELSASAEWSARRLIAGDTSRMKPTVPMSASRAVSCSHRVTKPKGSTVTVTVSGHPAAVCGAGATEESDLGTGVAAAVALESTSKVYSPCTGCPSRPAPRHCTVKCPHDITPVMSATSIFAELPARTADSCTECPSGATRTNRDTAGSIASLKERRSIVGGMVSRAPTAGSACRSEPCACSGAAAATIHSSARRSRCLREPVSRR
jgi:hypothetical protein